MSEQLLGADELEQLKHRILRRTREGQLIWHSDGDSQHSFKSVAGNSAFFVRSQDDDDRHPYDFAVHHQGLLLAVVTTDLGDDPHADEHNAWLEELYTAVKRQATGLDEKLRQVLSDLDDLEVPF